MNKIFLIIILVVVILLVLVFFSSSPAGITPYLKVGDKSDSAEEPPKANESRSSITIE